jgi:uncharacterized membrane protein YoaK (UPF0700 family)
MISLTTKNGKGHKYSMNRFIILLLFLSMVAGAIDVIGFLGLDGLFAAHITGNLVILCAHFVTGEFSAMGPLLAFPVFMVALDLVTVVGGKLKKKGASVLIPLLIFEILLLIGSFVLGIIYGPFVNFNSTLAVVTGMLAVTAMATQSATIKMAIKKAPSTVAMTANLTQLTLDLALIAGWHQGNDDERTLAKDNAKIVFTCILGFTLGCALGALFQKIFGFGALLLPIILTILALFLGPDNKKAT